MTNEEKRKIYLQLAAPFMRVRLRTHNQSK